MKTLVIVIFCTLNQVMDVAACLMSTVTVAAVILAQRMTLIALSLRVLNAS